MLGIQFEPLLFTEGHEENLLMRLTVLSVTIKSVGLWFGNSRMYSIRSI